MEKRWILYFMLASLSILWVIHKSHGLNQHGADVDDNEFAEFEDFDDEIDDMASETIEDEQVQKKQESPKVDMDDDVEEEEDDEFADVDSMDSEIEDEDAVVEVEEDAEFETYDPEEFEGLDGDDTIWENEPSSKSKKKAKPELKIANVPIHVRSWDKYHFEILMSFGIAVYAINFFVGKYMNSTIATSWFRVHKDYLESQFELVGDDPQNKTAVSTVQLTKESEHVFTLWCSGRVCVEGMLVELRMLKRQDLVSTLANKMKPGMDKVSISITLEDMDPFVLAFGNKKSIMNLQKNMQDLAYYCTDKAKSADKYDLPPNMVVVSELGEVVNAVLDSKVKTVIRSNEDLFDSLHVSDQFSGPKPMDQEEQPTKRPETIKTLNLVFNFPGKGKNPLPSEVPKMLPLMKMALYLADKVRKLRLSKESKAKADKNRQKIEMAFLKMTHSQRQEAAQQKKEEKEKAMKERIMNEEDPDKQRKLEELQHRRELKKKDKKMMKSRQMKVKAM